MDAPNFEDEFERAAIDWRERHRLAFLSLAASHRATRSVSSALNSQIQEMAHTPAEEFVEGVVSHKVRRWRAHRVLLA
jgi:hypothetical protein